MNIFFADHHPHKAAQQLHSRHVVKMMVESNQIMCTALVLQDVSNVPYKKTHENHPCVKWVLQAPENYVWLAQHTKGLIDEYIRRYPKNYAKRSNEGEFRTENVVQFCTENGPPNDDLVRCTRPPLAMPQEIRDAAADITDCVVTAYRLYLRHKYLDLWPLKGKAAQKPLEAGYNGRPVPNWLRCDDADFREIEIKRVQNSLSQCDKLGCSLKVRGTNDNSENIGKAIE